MTYDHPTRPHGAVKTFPPPVVAADPRDPPKRPRKPWVVRVPDDSIDHRKNGGLGHRCGWMLLVLERYCGPKPYCWAGDDELAAGFGCNRGTLAELLAKMEAAGLLLRVRPPKGLPGRVGIILFRRLDPDLPVADRDDPAGTIALLEADRAGRRRGGCPPDRARETAPAAPGKSGADRARETGRRIKTLDPKDETLTFARAGGGGGDSDPEAIGIADVPERPVALPPARETPEAGPIVTEAVAVLLADLAPIPGAEADPTPTPEQVEAEIADLEAKFARQSPRPPSAMDRIRLKNLRDLRDGTWKAGPLAGGAAPATPTPTLPAWPMATGPVETADLIRRVARAGSGPEAVEAAAVRVSERLQDGHSLAWYRKAFARVQSGEVPLSLALSAWKMAGSGSAKCPGSVFNARLKGGGRR